MRILSSVILIIMITTIVEAQDIKTSQKPYGGTLVWGTCHKPTIINPIHTHVSVSMSLLDLIFNRLVRINAKGEIEPDLAESWNISPDGLVYTFHLRKGVRFHDGIECTAEDAEFTYKKLIDLKVNSPFRTLFSLVKDFRATDKYTFQIILKKPSVPFIYRLVREIVPKHLLEDKDLKNCAFNQHPVGTGPFKFKDWTKDNQIILECNLDYYEGRPYLDKIIVKTFSDARDCWTALMRNEVDFALFIEEKDYEIVKNDASFKAYALPLDSYYAFCYNLNDPILADKRIRQAIAYGINRKEFIDTIAGGYGLECNGPFYPSCLGFNPEVKSFEYNPKKAQELLAEAGWFDGDGDGILGKEGNVLEINVLVDERSDICKKMVMLIRQQLQEIGIKTKVVLYSDDNMFTEEFLQGNKAQTQLKLLFAGMDPDQIKEVWSYEAPKRGDKLWVYTNEIVIKLFEQGEIKWDYIQRKQIYQKIHKLIYEDQPCCFIYFPFIFHVISSKIENTDEFFNLNMPFYTMKDWYVERTDERR